MSDELLHVSEISKSYSAAVKALSDVSFDLRAGEVHALVGENGAGKSTLSRIIAGLVQPDAGQMRLRANIFAPRKRSEAEARGVRIVTQELNLIGTLSIAENLFIDCMPHRFYVVDYKRMNREARDVMAAVGLDSLDPRRAVETLSVGQNQLIEIAASLARRSEVLILDEPTAALTDHEAELLFGQIAQLKASGVGIIYISHRMDEVKRLADRITVLRDGKHVATHAAESIDADEIVRLMIGRELEATNARRVEFEDAHLVAHIHEAKNVDANNANANSDASKNRPLALRVNNLRRGGAVRGVSFELRRGEILGFAGLMGAGRTETMRLIFGADKADAGEIYVGGSPTPTQIRSPRDAVRQGIALLTEDRKNQGLLLPLSVCYNTTLARMSELIHPDGRLRKPLEKQVAERFRALLGLRCSSVEQRVGELSGGNQQKVVLAKWLYRDSNVLICDEPTRGIDVGARTEIYKLLAGLAKRGKAVIVVSSDLQELLAICDLIAVMSRGKLVRTFKRTEFDRHEIMAAAFSEHRSEATPASTQIEKVTA